MSQGPRGGGGRGKNGQRLSQTVKSSLRGHFPCSLLYAKLEIFVLVFYLLLYAKLGMFVLFFLLVYGIPTFDPESFELNSMGYLVAALARISSKTLQCFGDQVSPHVHHERPTLISEFIPPSHHGAKQRL